MPILALPGGDTGLAGGDLPVATEEDVLAEFPVPIKRIAVAPVRDTFVSGWTAGFLTYQVISESAAAQTDPMRATGEYLRSFAEEHSVIPLTGESEESVRSRIYAAPQIVTPDAIVAGIQSIISPHSDGVVHLSELELDGWFVHAGDAVWDSFVGADPDYPDRYYTETPYLLPGGAVPSHGYPRSLLIRIPSLDANDETITYILDSDAGVFALDVDDENAMYVFADPQLAEDLYRAVIAYVESVKGQGISWALVIDPTL